jgi:hypothetical protein
MRRKRDRHSPSRAVMQWLASHDLGDAEIMASKSGFQEVAWPLPEAARIFLDHYFLTANTQTTPP